MAYKLGNDKTWVLSVVFFLLSFATSMAGQDEVGKATIGNGRFIEELEVEKLLEKMNKPAVKSI